ncbi:MobF family relaxase [Nocardioides sp. QY071]|uniref:MobF family relaxase n=1 Tax=Nocardioides sp. QY071 TaxID=3044187 RepID=UPI00249CCA10|nr:MobF family relaxase [Nocardioides sp. QY071]WGY02913.1 MobF family relaxase [Nocardioides sp. QY071]
MSKESSGRGVISVHGGVKFYRGSPKAARAYVERDRSRADDYYLGEGTAVATRLIATPDGVAEAPAMVGETYEKWVAGIDIDTGAPKGRLRTGADGVRFLEVVVNGPKTWSLAAALHPEISEALDAAQDRAAVEIVGWVAQHATTRIGPRGRQVQVPVERIEAAVIRHHTSRAGDPHRHLHLQVNARVFAAGGWRGIHSVGFRDSINAINGIGHAAVATDPEFRAALARHGFTLDPVTAEIRELAPYVGAFSARTRQIHRNLDAHEAEWRHTHPGQEPGPKLREAWDRRAWAQARPDKVIPVDGDDLVARWNEELVALGYHDPAEAIGVAGTLPGRIDRDSSADLVISRLGVKQSAWNSADIRGQVEVLLAQAGLVTEGRARRELAEDVTVRAATRCVRLVTAPGVPEHVRSLTSPRVLDVEAALIRSLTARGSKPARAARQNALAPGRLDPDQRAVAAALAGTAGLVVVEGAAGSGKTTALRLTQRLLGERGHRLLVVTPTLKAAQVAAAETGADGHSAAWLIHQHGWRWDADGHWTREPTTSPAASAADGALLEYGDLLLVDEAGMLDQDTAAALLTIADETGARIAFVGDRHQLPAVGRGGVLDHAVAWAHPTAVVTLDNIHRFTDPEYGALTIRMRTSDDPGAVFDELLRRGQVVIHPSEVERTAALADVGARGELVVADRRDHVTDLNAAIRDRHARTRSRIDTSDESDPLPWGSFVTTVTGEVIGIGDRVATRRNDPDLQVANRQTWTVTGIGDDGSLKLTPTGGSRYGAGPSRVVPAPYASRFVELAYATTVHGAQGDTVTTAHVAITDTTDAAAAYVAMTRGRDTNTAHLVADSVEDARRQWTDVFDRDRADLGPAHARTRAINDIDRYGPNAAGPGSRPLPPPTLRPSPSAADLGIGI